MDNHYKEELNDEMKEILDKIDRTFTEMNVNIHDVKENLFENMSIDEILQMLAIVNDHAIHKLFSERYKSVLIPDIIMNAIEQQHLITGYFDERISFL